MAQESRDRGENIASFRSAYNALFASKKVAFALIFLSIFAVFLLMQTSQADVSAQSSTVSGASSSLTIWDDTDGGDRFTVGSTWNKVSAHYIVWFYANYTDLSANPITDGCSIRFKTTGNYTAFEPLYYNSSKKLYETNKTYSVKGNFTYEVNCTNVTYDTLNVTDNFMIKNTRPWNIYVPSTPPMQSCLEDSICTYNSSANFTDDDTNDLPLSDFTQSSPSPFSDCVSISPTTGIITVACTTSSQAGGPYNQTVIVRDSDSDSTTLDLRWNIIAVNDLPTISFPASHCSGNICTCTQDSPCQFYIGASDEESGSITNGAGTGIGNLSFSANSTALFTINSTTGYINFTPTNSHVGNHSILVLVNDSANGWANKLMLLKVNDLNDQPNITFACDNLPSQQEDVPFFCYINATDVDLGQTHTYTSNYSWFNVSCSSVPVLNGNSSCIVNFAPTDEAVYFHQVKITVTDSGAPQKTDTAIINFTVNNTPDYPRFTTIANLTAWGNAAFSYTVSGYDDDMLTQFGDTVYYYDNTSLFNINETSGVIAFTPNNAQNGTYWVNITLNDSTGLMASKIINVTVYVNNPPVFGGAFNYNASEEYAFLVNLSINTTDPENDTFTFTDNTTFFDITSGGVISFTKDDADVGTQWVEINITDANGAMASYTLNFTVYNTPESPVLGTIQNQTNYTGNLITFIVTATDEDLFVPNSTEALTISMNASVTGMSFNGSVFSWTPMPTQNGTYWINFSVTDSTGRQDSQIMYINVTSLGYPPFFLDNQPYFCTTRNATEDSLFTQCTLWACDNDTGGVLNFRANYSWFIINTSNLSTTYYPSIGAYCANTTANFTPQKSQTGNWTIMFNLTDHMWPAVTTTINFTVYPINHAPNLTYIPDQKVTIGMPFYYDINATDLENDTLTFYDNTTMFDINFTTGVIEFIPNSTYYGINYVNISVTDGSLWDSQVIMFNVTNNSAPTCSLAQNLARGLFGPPPQSFTMNENESTGNFITTCEDPENDIFTSNWYWRGILNGTGTYPSWRHWNHTSNFTDSGNWNITLVVNDTPYRMTTYYWNVTVLDVNAPPILYKPIENISKKSDGNGWYKNQVNYRNLTDYFVDYDGENMTFGWYTLALNESFYDNNTDRINASWTQDGEWHVVNDSGSFAYYQNSGFGLKYSYYAQLKFSNITELTLRIKLASGNVAGICFGMIDNCNNESSKVFLNRTDNKAYFEQVKSGTSALNNSASFAIALNTSYWLKLSHVRNSTQIYGSTDNLAWSLLYNQSDMLGDITGDGYFALFTQDATAYFDDIRIKDPDLRNMTISIDEEADKMTFTPKTEWYGEIPMWILASDRNSTTESNRFYLHVDPVHIPDPEVVIQTRSSTTITQLTKVAGMEIIVPSLISLTPLSKTIIPVVINNSGELDLNTIHLVATSNQTELRLYLNETNWTILKVGDRLLTSLEIDIGLLAPDRYTIRLDADSKDPKVTDFAEIVIDVREKDAALKTQLKEQIQFTRDLFLQNPECLELWELIAEAEKMLNLYQYEKGLDLIHRAGQGCKDFISKKSEKEQIKEVTQSFIQLHWKTLLFELLALILAVALLMYYFKRRRFLKPF